MGTYKYTLIESIPIECNGLLWKQNVNIIYPNTSTIKESTISAMCSDGWRLPTSDELAKMVSEHPFLFDYRDDVKLSFPPETIYLFRSNGKDINVFTNDLGLKAYIKEYHQTNNGNFYYGPYAICKETVGGDYVYCGSYAINLVDSSIHSNADHRVMRNIILVKEIQHNEDIK